MGLAMTSFERISSGQMNRVYGVNEDLVLRFSMERDGRNFAKEARVLEALSGHVKVPEVLYADCSKSTLPFDVLVTQRKPGVTLAKAWLTAKPEEKQAYLKELCHELRKLHCTPPEEVPFLGQGEPWANRYEALLGETFREAASDDEIDPSVLQELQQYATTHRGILYEPTPTGLTHNDIHFENTLVHDGHIQAILDFEYADIAPLNLELAKWMNFAATPGTFVEACLEAHYQSALPELIKAWQAYYPELFKGQGLLERLRMYLIPDVLGGFKWTRVLSEMHETREQLLPLLEHEKGNKMIAAQRYEMFFKTHFLEDLLI